MTQQEKVYEALDKLKIEYKVIHHEQVHTIEEMDALGNDYFEGAKICKNFLPKSCLCLPEK